MEHPSSQIGTELEKQKKCFPCDESSSDLFS